MRIDAIAVFVSVLEAGSFAAAARSLGVPPSTVSARVAALERRLGVTLIQRTTRRLRPTAAGQRYFEECRQALRRLEAAAEAVTEEARENIGVLRLTAAVDIAQTILPPLIAGFRAAHPGLRIELIATDRLVDMIAERIDLALRPGPLHDSSLVTRVLVQGPTGLFASAAYVARRGAPATIADLDRHDVIGFSRLPGRLRMLRDGREIDVRFEGMITCDDMLAVRACIEHDLGIGLLPAFLADLSPRPLVRVLPELTHRVSGLYFAYPAQRYLPRRVRSFIDFATRTMRPSRPPAPQPP